jgi:hypothetical protein
MERNTPAWLLTMSPLDVDAKALLRALAEPCLADKPLGEQYKWRQFMSQAWEWLIWHNKLDANAAGVLRQLQPKWVEIYAASSSAARHHATPEVRA